MFVLRMNQSDDFVYDLNSLSTLRAKNLQLVAQVPHWQMGDFALLAMHRPGVRTTHSVGRIIFCLCVGCGFIWVSRLSGFTVVFAGNAGGLADPGLFFRIHTTDPITLTKRCGIV